jgi:hypothetical protein
MSPLIARLAWSALAGLITFIIVYIIGAILVSTGVDAGNILERFAPILGLLVAVAYFFSGRTGFHL